MILNDASEFRNNKIVLYEKKILDLLSITFVFLKVTFTIIECSLNLKVETKGR